MATNSNELKFSANLSTLFDDADFAERFRKAKAKGFTAVEAQFLYEQDIENLKKAKIETGLEVVLINSPVNTELNMYKEECFGIACIPGLEIEFIKIIHKSIIYAQALGCQKVHIIAGLKHNFEDDDLYQTYVNNLRTGIEILEEHNITALIEPMCSQVKENYYLDSFDKAVQVISDIGSPNLKLLLDVYHMHMLGIGVEKGIKDYLKYAGHIQISQAPKRNEPFSTGEIDYKKVFDILREMKYKGHIGLEYKPTDPDAGFEWLKE